MCLDGIDDLTEVELPGRDTLKDFGAHLFGPCEVSPALTEKSAPVGYQPSQREVEPILMAYGAINDTANLRFMKQPPDGIISQKTSKRPNGRFLCVAGIHVS